MDKHTQEYRMKKWLGIMQDCAESGVKKREYCQVHGINEKTFYYWQRRLRDCMTPALAGMRTAEPKETAFVRLPLPVREAAATCTLTAMVRIGNAEIMLFPDIEEGFLRKLLRVCSYVE